MRGVPRRVAAAMPVMMSDLRATVAGAGPVAARMVFRVGREIGRTVFHRAGENIVLVGGVTAPFHAVAVFVQSGSQDDVGVQMELIEIAGDQLSLRVVPGAGTDPAARGNAALSCFLGAEIGAPCAPGGPGSLRKLVAMSVGTFKAPQVSALSQTDTGNEESHRMILSNRERRAQQKQHASHSRCSYDVHFALLILVRPLPSFNTRTATVVRIDS